MQQSDDEMDERFLALMERQAQALESLNRTIKHVEILLACASKPLIVTKPPLQALDADRKRPGTISIVPFARQEDD